MEAGGFRNRLRSETYGAHQRLDALFSGIDITTQSGLALFAHCHRTVFAALKSVPGISTRHELSELERRLDHDLQILAERPISVDLRVDDVHPLAVDYMVRGSRMGTAVLRKRWLKSREPKVQAACAYFGPKPEPITQWTQFCVDLDHMDNASAEADTVIQSAQEIFGLFETAFHHFERAHLHV